MAVKTLLQMTQSILSSMESDEVNSINDTLEATQVAQVIRDSYESLSDNKNWPRLRTPVSLENSLDTTLPTQMTIPTIVKEVSMISYNKQKDATKRDRFEEVYYMEPDAFINHSNGLNEQNANVDRVTFFGMPINIMNDRAPTYYTNIKDDILLFDAYNSALESTLQSVNTQAMGFEEKAWVVDDDFIPDLPSEMFSTLLEESRSAAFYFVAQEPNAKAEQRATANRHRMLRKSGQSKQGIKFRTAGKRSTKGVLHTNPLFDKT